MKKPEEDDRIVMVGASFEEIAAEASAAVQREIDKQLQEVTPSITRALKDGAEFMALSLIVSRGQGPS